MMSDATSGTIIVIAIIILSYGSYWIMKLDEKWHKEEIERDKEN